MKTSFAISGLLLCSLIGTPAFAAAPAPTQSQIASFTQADEQLRYILTQSVFASEKGANAFYALGHEAACAALKPVMEKAFAQAAPQWQALVADVWRKTVPPRALNRAIKAGTAKGMDTLMPFADKIADGMRVASEPLLKATTSEIFSELTAMSAGIDADKIDAQARVAEQQKQIDAGNGTCAKSWAAPAAAGK